MAAARISSAQRAVDLRQSPPPLIIGERLNTQGSRRAKRMVLEGDIDGLVEIGRVQAADGAHCLDVCVATTERSDELDVMVRLVKRLSLEVDAPLVIDSTDPDVIEAAVRQAPGRPMINSINLEGDGSRFARLAPVMARYGLPAVAICIGPDGMARSPQQKLAVAEMMYEEGKKYGLREEQFVFDVITFTLGTGAEEQINAGVETLEGIRLVKARFPGAFTTLGLSNISFGLDPPSRVVINSVFLYHAVRAGLDSAIVNAREIVPYAEIDEKERGLAEDLIFNRRPDALADLVAHFDGAGPRTGARAAPDVDPSWPAARRANFRIVNRLKDGIEADVVHAVAEGMGRDAGGGGGPPVLDAPPEETHPAAIRVLNESLLPAMKEVGDKFGAGELILPFVLKSAECMKAAVGELERYLLKEEGTSKGTLVLGTVYGDVHDIGKNLVKTIFENNGYTVHDLGKQVPLQGFVDKIAETDPDAVGLSALLVSTSREMGNFVDHARRTGMDVPVLCGGAAVNSNYTNRIAKAGGIYGPGVFYCNTMFEGLKTMDALVSEQRPRLLAEWRKRLDSWRDTAPAPVDQDKLPRSAIVPVDPPAVADPGRIVRLGPGEIPLDEVWGMMDMKSLFKLSWGLRGRAGRASEAEHAVLLEQWKERIVRERLFEPRAVYGMFRCSGDGRRLEVRGPDGTVTFDFPRSARPGHLCIADYFGTDDVVAFQAVTVGGAVAETVERWNAENRYTDAYYLHGLAVEAAEGIAAWVNGRIMSEMGLAEGCLRYSWGYGSCPDVSQHRLVWRLLHPEESGMTLTESGQIVPEQSTAAMVVHHPEAAYFET